MNYLVIDKIGCNIRVKDPYNDLESLGRYLIMKEMKDDQSGKFNVNDIESISDFIDSRVSHYHELDESVLVSREEVLGMIVTDIVSSNQITDFRSGNALTIKEMVFVQHSMYEILNSAIYFQ